MADKPAAKTTELVFIGTSMVRQERNEWGDKVRKRYKTGDSVEVLSADVEKLLAAEVGGRAVWVKSEKDADSVDEDLPRDDVDPTAGNADVKRSAVTTDPKVVPKDDPQKITTVSPKKIGSDSQ